MNISKETITNSKEKENLRIKELKKILFDNSSILKNLPQWASIYEKNNAMRALYFLPLSPNEQPTINFRYLQKKVFLRTDPDSPGFDTKGIEFREMTSKNEKVREKIENIFVKEFSKNLERHYLVKELCWKKDYDANAAKYFKELRIDNTSLFFDNLFKHIDAFDNAKDILIIADRKTYRFIKQNETGKFLENYVGNILEADLENNIKLIIASQKVILIPYWINPITDKNYSSGKEYHYLEINYEIDLIDNNQIILFKEENTNKK